MLFRDIYLSVLILLTVAAALFSTVPTHAETLAERLSGKILLQVEANGEAWYVLPDSLERYFLGRPDDAFRIMRELSLGISNADLAKIPEAGTTTTGDLTLRNRLSGKILLQVEANGEAWYVNTETLRRHYMGRPTDAFNLMRQLGLGISTENLLAIPIAKDSTPLPGNGTPAVSANLNDGLDSIRTQILGAINSERAAKGVPAVVLVYELSRATQDQANDMQAKQYVNFTSPDGRTIKEFAEGAGYQAYTLAENLVQTSMTPSGVVGIWKNQGGVSYENAIHPDHEHVGIGVATVDGVKVYAVVFAVSFATHFEEATAGLANLDTVRALMLNRVNDERIAAGLPALTMHPLLNISAQGHANDMFNRAYYAHESPEGTTVFTRVTITGYEAQLAAENIAKNQLSVTEVMDSWMDSPGHRANILDTAVTDVGFGLAYGKNAEGYTTLWVQNFAQPQ